MRIAHSWLCQAGFGRNNTLRQSEHAGARRHGVSRPKQAPSHGSVRSTTRRSGIARVGAAPFSMMISVHRCLFCPVSKHLLRRWNAFVASRILQRAIAPSQLYGAMAMETWLSLRLKTDCQRCRGVAMTQSTNRTRGRTGQAPACHLA